MMERAWVCLFYATFRDAGKSNSKSNIEGWVYFSTLLASCLMWSAALDSSDVLNHTL